MRRLRLEPSSVRYLTIVAGLASAVGLGFGCRPRQNNVSSVASGPADEMWKSFHEGFDYEAQGLDEQAKTGRKIWYFATGGNGRHHSKVLPQTLGLLADYYNVLGAQRRGKDRFKLWGIIPDPSCMTPEEAEAKYGPGIWADPELKSFGFDVCPGDLGDKGLFAAVGNPARVEDGVWKDDPACEIDCRLHFGTSTGGMGFRKFPNPRFNKAKWLQIKGWDGYSKQGGMLTDASIEPPFLIGHTCGSCHISFNPEKPPVNPELPAWENLKGAVGAQYLHISEILGSGMPDDSLEWQIFTHARPGTSDTSAVTHDGVNNPGTMNAILNTNVRPGVVNSGLPGSTADAQSRLPRSKHTFRYYGLNGEPGWKDFHDQYVPQILKGGEDTVSVHGAVQRVYLNIGLCSEACLTNNLQDLRAMVGRRSRQTPFRIDQCFRDCPEFVSISKHTTDVFKFLVEQEGFRLDKAMGLPSRAALVDQLGKDKVKTGMQVFAAKCARCHSSRVDPNATPQQMVNMLAAETSPYYLLKEDERGRLLDWMGNDVRRPATEVESYRCRALHSNHMPGHLWEQYAAKTLHASEVPAGIAELKGATPPDGRGYYRDISLVSLWAFAPFLHNNALGAELCTGGAPTVPIGPWADPARGGQCVPPNPSVEARVAMFEQSLKALFRTPDAPRQNKIVRTDKEIVMRLGPKFQTAAGAPEGVEIKLPAGMPVTLLGSIDQRKMIKKVLDEITASDDAETGMRKFAARMAELYQKGPDGFAQYMRQQAYVNCGQPLNATGDVDLADIAEDQGHNFLSFKQDAATNVYDEFVNDEELQGLLAFLKLL
jgi:hypothetical protein